MTTIPRVFALLSCLILQTLLSACVTTDEELRLLRPEERSKIEKFVGTYTGQILPRKTTRTDIKPLVSDVKLTLEIKDETLALTSDKDLSGGECDAELGRLMSLNFSEKSAIATFAYGNAKCPLPVNISEIAVEFRELNNGTHRATTKLPKLILNSKTGKKPKKPTHLFGVFVKEGTVPEGVDPNLEPEPDPDMLDLEE